MVFPAFHLMKQFNVNAILSQSAVSISSQKVRIAIGVWIGPSCEKHLRRSKKNFPKDSTPRHEQSKMI